MTWLSEHWLQALLLAGYLLILAHHAWAGKRRTHSMADYLAGGRGMGGVLIGLSFYATFMSTNTFIGAAGKSWDVGLVWCVGGVVLTALCCISWFFVAPRFVPLTRKYGSLTVADFLGFHYGSPAVRKSAAAITAFASLVYLVAIYQGSALALASFLDLSFGWCVLLVFLVVTSYTLAGGFSSVVLTDALQGVLMVAGAVGIPLAIILQAGGLENVWTRLEARDPALLSWEGNMPIRTILALSLAVGIKYLVEPRQLSRFYGLRDNAAVRRAAVVAPLLVAVTYAGLMPVGAMAHALAPADAVASSDEVVPYLLGTVNVLGPLLGVMFLLVLVSAAMSSIDSVLLVAASTVDRDLLGHATEGMQAVQRTRGWVVAVSLASAVTCVTPLTNDIVTMTAFSGSLYGACFFPALVMGLYRKRRDSRGALISMLCGAAAVIGWFGAQRLAWVEIHEVWVGMAVGIGSFLIADLLPTRPAPADDPQTASEAY